MRSLKSSTHPPREQGFTLVELVIGFTVLAVISLSIFGLFTALVNSAVIAKQKAIASTLATNQMEYLKSLSYDSLAVAGGSIYTANPLPASTTQKINGLTYTIKTSINYVDDAYDGCTNYPTLGLKQLYCRNYPPPAGAPAVDSNPADYKIIHVSVYSSKSAKLAEVDTEVSARVAETASTTGALFVTTIDENGNPVSGATVAVANSVINPAVNLSDSTDANGVAIFYGLPPDTTNYDYNVTASKSGYSTLTTIAPAGALQPTYPNQKIFNQQSSSITLTIKPQGTYSLAIETTDTTGSPLANVKVYAKGGYKKYTSSSDTAYYYDTISPSDTRPVTDSVGLASLSNLVPGNYIFCGDAGTTSCSINGTTYYLVAALPYGGPNPFYPMSVPRYDPASPPATTFPFNGNSYLQKVRLVLTTNANAPRISSLSPYDASIGSGTLNNFSFAVSGANLPCSASAASCATTIRFLQGSNTYTAACTGSSAGLQLNCTVNLTGTTAGNTQMVVSANGYSFTMPVPPPQGGLIVIP